MGKAFDKVKEFFGVSDDEYSEDNYIEENSASEIEEKAAVKKEKAARNYSINPATQLDVVLVKPERFEDASSIADHLNSKRTVVLNLESTAKDVARRLVDFLSGVAYANNGQIKRVANSTFIITPYNVEVSGEQLDEIESGSDNGEVIF